MNFGVPARKAALTPVLVLLAFLASPLGVSDAAAQAWYDVAWDFRLPITVEPTMIEGDEPFSDFPLLLVLDGTEHAEVFANAKSDGSDLVVTTGDGTTVLEREVAEYDATGQSAEIWVRATALSKTENEFYLYYGNPAAALDPAPLTAWSPDYKAVYHFAEDPGAGTLHDSSADEAHATLDPARLWTSGDVTDGQVGQAWLFNGDTHHVASYMSTQDSSYVLSAWLLNTNRSTDFFIQAQPGFWHTSAQATDQSQQPDYVRTGTTVRFFPDPIPINDGYHHFAWVFDHIAQTVDFYFDGVQQGVHSTVPFDLETLYIGQAINPDGSFIVGILGPRLFNEHDLMTGGGDEFRLHEGVLSGDWILTEVRNQSAPADFLSYGLVEVPVAPTSFGDLKRRFGGD